MSEPITLLATADRTSAPVANRPGASAQLSWTPSAEASKRILFYVGIILVVISAIAFGISFDSVMIAARPVFGDAAWAIPLLLDATLAVLTAAGLVLELNGLRARLPQYFARVLIAVTVYANVEPAHGLFPRIMHGAPPVTWAVLVLIAERTVRKLASLTAENKIEGIRRSLWLLRPVATLRIWRRMRIHQLPTYLEGLDRDAARAAVVGRMRLRRSWNRLRKAVFVLYLLLALAVIVLIHLVRSRLRPVRMCRRCAGAGCGRCRGEGHRFHRGVAVTHRKR